MIKLKKINMITSKELRIGNIVSQGIIIEIRQCTARVRYNVDGKERTSLIRYDDLEPIILTEDWLLKAGFKWNEAWGSFIKNGFMVEKIADILCERKHGVVIKNIHQLQNLYFAICGKELKVKQ